jgi:hypothetical protein
LWILSNRETLTKVCSGLILPFFGLVSVAEKEVRAVTDVVTAKQECGTVMDIKPQSTRRWQGPGLGPFFSRICFNVAAEVNLASMFCPVAREPAAGFIISTFLFMDAPDLAAYFLLAPKCSPCFAVLF